MSFDFHSDGHQELLTLIVVDVKQNWWDRLDVIPRRTTTLWIDMELCIETSLKIAY